MANNDGAFGLRPVRHLTGGEIRTNEYAIAASATAMYTGSIVIATAAGGCAIGAANSTDILGVFTGCFYTDPTSSKPTWSRYWPNNAASDAVAFVCDDPDVVYEVQTDGTVTDAAINANADTAGTSGSTTTGVSTTELSSTITGSGTAQLRIIGRSKDPDNTDTSAANSNWYVIINEHAYRQTGGTQE